MYMHTYMFLRKPETKVKAWGILKAFHFNMISRVKAWIQLHPPFPSILWGVLWLNPGYTYVARSKEIGPNFSVYSTTTVWWSIGFWCWHNNVAQSLT